MRQLLPFVRFDGYYILSDLVGVPDLFARAAPIVKSVLPAGRRDPRVTGLRRGARIVVTGWVVCVIPLLMFMLGSLLLYLPQINRALWRSASMQAHLVAAETAGRRGRPGGPDGAGRLLDHERPVRRLVAGSVRLRWDALAAITSAVDVLCYTEATVDTAPSGLAAGLLTCHR